MKSINPLSLGGGVNYGEERSYRLRRRIGDLQGSVSLGLHHAHSFVVVWNSIV